MNEIDKKFSEFIQKLEKFSINDIYINIKANYFKVHPDTRKSLQKFLNQFNYWGILDEDSQNFEQIMLKAKMLKYNLDKFKWLYDNLEDYRSKKLLYGILNNFYCYDFKTLSEVRETSYKDYFDVDVIKTNKDDVFVDLGAFTGDTITDYINTYGENYKKIYAFEMTDTSFAYLKENTSKYSNIEYIKKAIGDENKIIYIKENEAGMSANKIDVNGDKEVEMVTLDSYIDDDVTVIKMDIEGAEQKALMGAKNHIIKNHPKLLISVYHNNEDLYKIPMMIKEMNPSYKFYLRYHGGNIYPTEITLIAV